MNQEVLMAFSIEATCEYFLTSLQSIIHVSQKVLSLSVYDLLNVSAVQLLASTVHLNYGND